RLRVAFLGATTIDHLAPSIRIGALRRGLIAEISVMPYGQWRQQILDPEAELYACKPQCVVLAPDMASLLPRLPLSASADAAHDAVEAATAELSSLWRMVRERTNAAVLQELPWLAEPSLYGHFEDLVPVAPAALTERLRRRVAEAAAEQGILI